jgi:ApaG protein
VSSSKLFLEPEGLRVTVDRVIYNPEARAPADRPHCFIYVITIHNGSDHAVTIKGRKWVVTNDCGEVTALEGQGVVGQSPKIDPGQKFTYNSFHFVNTRTAKAEGSYVGMDDLGRKVLARIPAFQMAVPGN